MPELFSNTEAQAPITKMILHVAAAMVMGFMVAWLYRATHRRDTSYAPTFLSTLVLLCVLIAVVTSVIGDSVAKAFSLVGALSIVRYRTIVSDTRDTAFVIFAVVVGMANGSGHPAAGAIALVAAGLCAFVMQFFTSQRVAAEGSWKLVIRIALSNTGTEGIDQALATHAEAVLQTGSSTSRQGSAMDLTYQIRLKPWAIPSEVVGGLNRVEGVISANLERL